MINSIPKIEGKKFEAFGQVTQRQAASDYWLPVQHSEDKFEKEGNLAAIKIITPE